MSELSNEDGLLENENGKWEHWINDAGQSLDELYRSE
jgi:hypothetical protein